MESADEALGGLIVRMRLATINQLNWAYLASNSAQPLGIMKEQVGAFIGAGAARKANG